jgi:Ti-type conjugative transfer relaxase TraA
VLSIGRLSGPDSERYYLDKVARGREDYYSGRGEMPGQWAGSATDLLLESDGEVSDEQFSALLAGNSPTTGEPLGRTSHRSVHGFDLTFRAPKSVSLLYGIGDPSVSAAAREAHDDAVREALGYLEREACWTRRGTGGTEHLRGDGFVAAAFRHRTSRAGDPTLHTHVVLANVTHADGRWSALDSRQLYRHAKTAGYLYQAALRAHLSVSLGVSWEVVHHGTADITGVPRRVIEHFSTRRAEILEYMAERGEHSARAAQIATLQTRAPKLASEPFDRLRADWRARAAEQGFGQHELAELITRCELVPADRLEEARLIVDQALPELTEQSSTFDRRDVVRAWAERHRTGASVARVEAAADAWLQSSEAVTVEGEVQAHKLRRYSTPEMLRIESELLDGARARKRCGAGRAPKPLVDEVLARRPELGEEQASMVRRLTVSGDGVQVVRAAAGTGKTYALDAAREVWQSSGHPVIGCALSARAAVELHDQTGIPSSTLARLQHDLRRGHPLPDGAVVVVDEAGMVGTRALAELAEHARRAQAKLVICGDDRQLPEIDAGGGLRGLAKQLGAIELREVRRQHHEWDRAALRALRQGRLEEWADAYREHGRIVAGNSAADVRARLVDDWHRARTAHPDEDHVMLAHRRADVAELNERARERLRSVGQLGELEIRAGERAFAEGDRVVTTRNDRASETVNGERGVVTEIDQPTDQVTVRFDSGRECTLPSGYVADGHLDHAYAMTAHRAQGATVDRAFVLGSDDLYREWGYTALSRHRQEARFYVNLGREAQLALPGLDINRERPADPVTGPLSHRHAKQLALDIAQAAGRTPDAPIESTAAATTAPGPPGPAGADVEVPHVATPRPGSGRETPVATTRADIDPVTPESPTPPPETRANDGPEVSAVDREAVRSLQRELPDVESRQPQADVDPATEQLPPNDAVEPTHAEVDAAAELLPRLPDLDEALVPTQADLDAAAELLPRLPDLDEALVPTQADLDAAGELLPQLPDLDDAVEPTQADLDGAADLLDRGPLPPEPPAPDIDLGPDLDLGP